MREQLCLHRTHAHAQAARALQAVLKGRPVPGLLDSGSHRLGQLAREARGFSPFSTPVSLQVQVSVTAGPSFLKSGL